MVEGRGIDSQCSCRRELYMPFCICRCFSIIHILLGGAYAEADGVKREVKEDHVENVYFKG